MTVYILKEYLIKYILQNTANMNSSFFRKLSLEKIINGNDFKKGRILYEIRWLWNFRKRYGNYGSIL